MRVELSKAAKKQFDVEDDRIDVFKIAPRGDVYKE